jgi:prepilin-type N-terminal cleavage/methylation domain-containing protein
VKTRSGFTLIELVVVLAILGGLGGAIGMLLLRQQRFYRGASEILYAREGVRDALEVLSTDILGIAAADTVRLLADSAMEMFSSIGSSVLCQGTGDSQIGLPAASPGNTLSSFVTQPDTGDLVLFYRASINDGSRWERHRITAFSARSLASTCPPTSAFTRAEDLAAEVDGFQVVLEAPLTNDVGPGAPVRFIRRGRYSLYHGSDGEWYLGYRRCNAVGPSTCGAIQPLSGPYRPYSSDRGATGLLFDYFDAYGVRMNSASSPLELARVDITARAQSRQRLIVEGRGFTPADSATVSIAIRNR